MSARRCRNRCWFAVGVGTGVQAPVCQRCGRPNPRWSEAKRQAYDEYMRPPDDFEWVRCYEIDGSVDDKGLAFCPLHGRRYSYKKRSPNPFPFHLYLVNHTTAQGSGPT